MRTLWPSSRTRSLARRSASTFTASRPGTSISYSTVAPRARTNPTRPYQPAPHRLRRALRAGSRAARSPPPGPPPARRGPPRARLAGDGVGAPDEVGDVVARRRVVDPERRRHRLDLTTPHDGHPVAQGERLGLVVGDEDGGDAGVLDELPELDLHRVPKLRVEGVEWLVEVNAERGEGIERGAREVVAKCRPDPNPGARRPRAEGGVEGGPARHVLIGAGGAHDCVEGEVSRPGDAWRRRVHCLLPGSEEAAAGEPAARLEPLLVILQVRSDIGVDSGREGEAVAEELERQRERQGEKRLIDPGQGHPVSG